LIVYDATFRDSFDNAKKWVEDLRKNANVADIVIAIVGNKSDMAGSIDVQLQEAHEYGKQVNAEIIRETSAKDNNGVNELFQEVARKLLKKHKAKQVSRANGHYILKQSDSQNLKNSNLNYYNLFRLRMHRMEIAVKEEQ
jgi:GTPase SAR1 family protein